LRLAIPQGWPAVPAYSHRRMSLKNKTRISGLPGLLSYWI
jgi:hypothetical protein